MNNDNQRVVYSINVEDVQTVAIKEIGRPLDEDEIEIIADKLGDTIEWYDEVANAIRQYVCDILFAEPPH